MYSSMSLYDYTGVQWVSPFKFHGGCCDLNSFRPDIIRYIDKYQAPRKLQENARNQSFSILDLCLLYLPTPLSAICFPIRVHVKWNFYEAAVKMEVMSEECASNASDHYWFRERTFEAAKLLLLWGRPFLYRYASVKLTVTELPIKSEGKHLAGLWVKTRKP